MTATGSPSGLNPDQCAAQRTTRDMEHLRGVAAAERGEHARLLESARDTAAGLEAELAHLYTEIGDLLAGDRTGALYPSLRAWHAAAYLHDTPPPVGAP